MTAQPRAQHWGSFSFPCLPSQEYGSETRSGRKMWAQGLSARSGRFDRLSPSGDFVCIAVGGQIYPWQRNFYMRQNHLRLELEQRLWSNFDLYLIFIFKNSKLKALMVLFRSPRSGKRHRSSVFINKWADYLIDMFLFINATSIYEKSIYRKISKYWFKR